MGRSEKEKEPDKRKRSKGDEGWLSDIRYGRTVSVELFRKNAWLLVILVVTIIALIGLRYKTRTKMAEIKRLNEQLERTESEMLSEKAQYMSLIRESEMTRMVAEKRLNLQFQERPPYRLSDGTKEKKQ